ncbi:hypothetical protein HDZ31DRAFT_51580, partial [Schizophyllum fasciatum]
SSSPSAGPQSAAAAVPSAAGQTSAPQPAAQDDDRLCSECGKRFTRPSALQAHMNSHTGAKPFRCGAPGCDAAFATRSNMLRHRRLHGSDVFATLEEAERRAAAVAPTPIVFNKPIVNEGSGEGAPGMDVQWMAPNQTARPYTRYPDVTPTNEGDASTSAGPSGSKGG